MKTITLAKKIKRFFRSITAAVTAAVVILPANAFAAGDAPAGVQMDTFDSILTIVMWVVRIIILACSIPSIVKIVQGQVEENPRDRNSGILGVVVVGAVFAATFAIQALMKG